MKRLTPEQDASPTTWAAVAVLRTLDTLDARIHYREFLEAIGILKPEEPWPALGNVLCRDVLNTAAAFAERHRMPLEMFGRVVERKSGEPGKGFGRLL